MLQAVRLFTEMARTSDDHPRSLNGHSSSQASSSLEVASILFREIHKNGWLRRTDIKAEKDWFWVTFCIHDDTEPRLEGFNDEKHASLHSPVWTQTLRNALYLSPTLVATARNDYEFCVNYSGGTIRLAAPTYQTMSEWIQVITRKLTDMKILKPKENIYSRGPERIATRDPTSPLPPPPNTAGVHRDVNQVPSVFTFDDNSIEEHNRVTNGANRPARLLTADQRSVSLNSRLATTSVSNNDNSRYESVFLASSTRPQQNLAGNSDNSNNRSRSVPNDDQAELQYAALMEYRSSDASIQSGANQNQNGARMGGLQLTLREQQVLQLRKEMSHPGGVRLKLNRRDCKDGIAFVDCFDSVWIAGWKQKEHPLLYNVLHIGDLVLSISGIQINGVGMIRDILKNYSLPRVDMIVKRLPHARVMTLTRRSELESFGLEVSGNEVLQVSPSVQSAGLPIHSAPADPLADTIARMNWMLTEVNNRPLNLIDGNARERLNTVGRDVSVVLQPSDLVTSIKKKLRAVRNYKNFVLQ